MKILVDADACPAKDIIEDVAKKNNVPVKMYCDLNHVLNSDYSTVEYVDSGFQSVDMSLINDTRKGDIVVSQDYGVAAMALGKGAYAISPKGYIYDDSNIDKLLLKDIYLPKLGDQGEGLAILKRGQKKMTAGLKKICLN